jgi:magnesium transporter
MFSRLGYDPALGSGPVATVIQDVLSLAIYFLIAAVLLF